MNKKIILSDDVEQETPVGFMVFCYKDIDHDYLYFGEESDARDYAMEQEEKADLPDGTWKIYPLWAGEALN